MEQYLLVFIVCICVNDMCLSVMYVSLCYAMCLSVMHVFAIWWISVSLCLLYMAFCLCYMYVFEVCFCVFDVCTGV